MYTGLTAWCALKIAGGLYVSNTAKKNVLVIGGSGGVGNCAIQLLKYWGAKVRISDIFICFVETGNFTVLRLLCRMREDICCDVKFVESGPRQLIRRIVIVEYLSNDIGKIYSSC